VSRDKQKLVITDNKGTVVATGDEGTKSVTLTGVAADTNVPAGTYQAAYQNEEGKVGESVDVPAFKTLATTTTTSSSTTTAAK